MRVSTLLCGNRVLLKRKGHEKSHTVLTKVSSQKKRDRGETVEEKRHLHKGKEERWGGGGSKRNDREKKMRGERGGKSSVVEKKPLCFKREGARENSRNVRRTTVRQL